MLLISVTLAISRWSSTMQTQVSETWVNIQVVLVLFAPGSLFVACQAVSTLLSLAESSEILHLLPVERIKNLVT